MTPMDPADPLEEALRRTLRHVDPPQGFAERVIQRASRSTERQRLVTGPLGRWAVAATLVAAAGGGLWYRAEEQRRTQGEEARRQVLLSLSIAGSKLRSVQMQVHQVNQVNEREERQP